MVLVRHGQSSFNAAGLIQGRSDDSVLTEKGREGARLTGEALRDLNFDAAYCSPLQRAKHTAEIIVSSLTSPPSLEVHPQLMEIDLPNWAGLTREQVETDHAEGYRLWKQEPHAVTQTREDGTVFHPVRSLFDQAREFWGDLLARHPGGSVLVVAHNGILRSLISTALGVGPERYQTIRQSNCGVSVLNFSGGLGEQVQLESLNVTAHLGEPVPTRDRGQGVRLLLVRHGETEWNRMGRFQGQIDIPLNDNGRHQARAAAGFLADQPLDFAVSSPMARPRETAETILAQHPDLSLGFDDGFKEIGHGLWEGKLESEIAADYAELLADWKVKPETVQMPEGENIHDVWDRSVAAWENVVARAPEGSTGLVVAHDAVNKVILCQVLGLEPKDIWAVKQGNCAVTVVDYPKGLNAPPVVQALNITSHLGGVLDRTAAGAL